MKNSLTTVLTTALSLLPGATQSQVVGIPTNSFRMSGDGVYQLQRVKRIVIDKEFAQLRDTSGLTLIPPTLREFASTFAQDLQAGFGINAAVDEGSKHDADTIFLTIDGGHQNDYLDAAGRPTSEGYALTMNNSGIVISGASPLGTWWGTRTVLQLAALSGSGRVPFGTGVDAPGWGERGMMLDVARHYYPKEFLIDMCSYMSFFKQNTFHIHLSDNVVNSRYDMDNFRDLYARFRLWSDGSAVQGLNNYANESYTRADFDELQIKCAARGVTILPELESPGHALPIVQWKPQVGYGGDLSQLNLTHPDTIPAVKAIWKEFLPWFHTKIVSIGADEYEGEEEEYKKFVNTMNAFIHDESSKGMRIWGTFPPKKGHQSPNEVSKNVSIQHWSYSFDNPLNDYIKNNYAVLNSDEMFYIVLKCCGFAPTFDISKIFTGNPVDKGPWFPNIFSLSNAAENAARDEPLIRGAIAPMWNDRGANTSVYSEAYYAWKNGIPALADKQWGGNLTQSQFENVFLKLQSHITAQNLERTIPSEGSAIFKYDLGHQQIKDIQDLSPNGYNAQTSCKTSGSSVLIMPDCSITTPLASKGRNYTLSLTLKVDKLGDVTNTTLVAGTDSLLMLTPSVTLFAAGNYYRLESVTVPLNQWVTLTVVGRGERTFASVMVEGATASAEEEFLTAIGMGNAAGDVRWYPMAIEAPVRAVTGWTGELRAWSLTSEA